MQVEGQQLNKSASKKQTKMDVSQLVIQIKAAHIKLENLQKDFDERTKKFSGLSQTMTVNFECSLTREAVKYAVILAECFKGFKHYDSIIDLEQFLLQNYNSTDQQQNKQFACPICKGVTKFEQIDKAFYPHIVINQLREKCGQFPRQLMYCFADKIYYPLHKGKMGNVQNSYFEQIKQIIRQGINPKSQFYQLVKILNVNCSFLFYNNCSLNSIKVMIPVRGSQCNHFEVYDLTSLLIHFEKKEKQFKCKRPECNSMINIDNLCLDRDLFDSCLKSYSFTFSFAYNNQTHQLEDILEKEKDLNLLKYRQINSLSDYLIYQSKIYKIVDQIYTSPINQERTEEFYDQTSIETIKKEGMNFMFCQFTGQRIELPCRCIRCKQVQTCDLRYMSCVLNQFQNPAETKQVLNVIDYCPLCKTPFTKKVKPKDIPLFEQIYVDVKMMNFLTQTTGFANVTQEAFIRFLNNKVTSRIIVKRDIDSFLKGKNAIVTMELKCCISNIKIRRPIRGNKCSHPQPFDYKIIDMHLNGEIDLSEMKCPICKQDFEYFIEDYFIKDELDIFYAQQLQECKSVCININKDKIFIKPRHII